MPAGSMAPWQQGTMTAWWPDKGEQTSCPNKTRPAPAQDTASILFCKHIVTESPRFVTLLQ